MNILSRDDKGNVIHRGDVLVDVEQKDLVFYYFFSRNCVVPLSWQAGKVEDKRYTLDELKESGYIKIAMNKHIKDLTL